MTNDLFQNKYTKRCTVTMKATKTQFLKKKKKIDAYPKRLDIIIAYVSCWIMVHAGDFNSIVANSELLCLM